MKSISLNYRNRQTALRELDSPYGATYQLFDFCYKAAAPMGQNSIQINEKVQTGRYFLLIKFGAYILIFLFLSCNRISSRSRSENVTKAQIPDGFDVIEDKFDGWKDYTLSYKIHFDSFAARKYIQNIKHSELYKISLSIDITKKNLWTENEHGYKFETKLNRIYYRVNFDTTSKICEFYEECN